VGLLIDMIDVGQGDSFLLTIDGPHGEVCVLIDAGLPDAGSKVLNYVSKYASSGLDMVVATHIDNDHVGGMATILTHASLKDRSFFVLNVPPVIAQHWTPARKSLERYKGIVSFKRVIEAVDTVKTLSALANQRGMTINTGLQGQYWTCGDVRLDVLNPTKDRLAAAWEESRLDRYIQGNWEPGLVSIMESVAEAPSTSPENDSSIVIEVSVNGIARALMTSDAGAAVLKEVTAGKSYSFLKVPHHGSDTGLDEELIQQISPQNAAIPVGDNPHGHPSLEILEMLKSVGARTYCSSKTKNCRKSCTFKGGNISFPLGKPTRAGWLSIDKTLCANNP